MPLSWTWEASIRLVWGLLLWNVNTRPWTRWNNRSIGLHGWDSSMVVGPGIMGFLTHWGLGDFDLMVKIQSSVFFLLIDFFRSCDNAFRWMPWDGNDDNSTLVQAMACCQHVEWCYWICECIFKIINMEGNVEKYCSCVFIYQTRLKTKYAYAWLSYCWSK